MNSATWLVDDGASRWVAKSVVPGSRDQFVAGLTVAGRLQRAGIPAGAPVPTVGGQDVVAVGGYPLALLSWVAGDALTGESEREQRLIGVTLARVHRALAAESIEGVARFHWVDPAAAHLAVRGWVRPAVAAAVEAVEALGLETLSWGLLHTDPAPEAFRLDPATGVCGVIDWSVALAGPLLYDLASAVMYVGGAGRAGELVAAYLGEDVLTRSEVERGLLPMLRFRWAVQADYFARRIVEDDLTGISGPQENEKGLDDARRRLRPDLAAS
ncbi:serine kinase [Actinoplanes sp. ATCC 53533]|uniref:phosphotransferase enzyme family protein n=1 Tax=Actinoplanes sp. ATCC 53533 TaxID=1288362 RepID=UPI000F790A0C|nr:serine kinase [Actinoplanes sp. ATCC 53533]